MMNATIEADQAESKEYDLPRLSADKKVLWFWEKEPGQASQAVSATLASYWSEC